MAMIRNFKSGLSISWTAPAVALAMVGWIAVPADACPGGAQAAGAKTAAARGFAEKPCHAAGGESRGAQAASDKPCHLRAKGDSLASGKEGCAGKPCKGHGSSKCGMRGKAAHHDSFRTHREAPHSPPDAFLAGDPEENEMREQLARFEFELQRLSEQLEQMSRQFEESRERRAKWADRAPRRPIPPRPPRAEHGPRGPRRDIRKDGTTVQAYTLSPGKLEALVDLMARSDVPILIRPLGDRIEVRGTPAEQGAFARFVRMIDPEKTVVAYRIPPGRLEALIELMGRSDVPVFIEPGEDRVVVHGTTLEQEVFRAFVELIAPDAEKAFSNASSEPRNRRFPAPRGDRQRAKILQHKTRQRTEALKQATPDEQEKLARRGRTEEL